MKIEKLEDLLEINTDSLKAPENKRILTKIKQLLKSGSKQDTKKEESAKDLPFDAISVVGNSYVEIKFDLETKEARVVNTEVDTRDTKNRNYMAGARAIRKIQELVKSQRES